MRIPPFNLFLRSYYSAICRRRQHSPDGCSDTCCYCGNPADFSSHTFTTYVCNLKAEAVKVVRVENAVVDGKTVETWTEMEFTLENGLLTFKTDRMSVFLLVDKDEQPPVIG